MADLVTTIKVDSKQFDNSIKESTNQVRKFERENYKTGKQVEAFGGKISGIASGALMGMAGTLGLAYGATESFTKILRSSQATSDAFDVTIAQAKTSVDYFFTTISTGNWDNFFTGILKATEYAKDFTEYMDKLGDIKVSTQFFSGSEQRLISEQRAILSDPDAKIEEKESALNILESVNKRVEERARAHSDTSKDAIKSKISVELNKANSRAYDAFREISEEEKQEIYNMLEGIDKLDISGGQKYFKFKEGLAEKGLVLEDGLVTSIFKAVISQLSGNKTPGSNASKSKGRLEYEFKNQLAKDVVDNLEDWELPLYGIENRNDYDPALVLTSTFFEKALSGTDKEYEDFEEKLVKLNKEIDGLRELEKLNKKTTDKEGNPMFNMFDYVLPSSFSAEDAEKLNKLEEERFNLVMSDPVSNALVELKNVVMDDTNKELAQLNQESENELTKVANNQRIINRERKRLETERKRNKPDIFPDGSIADIDKQIAGLNKKISLSVNEEDRRELYKQIEELQAKKLELETKYKAEPELPQTSLAAIDKKIKELNQEISLSINEEDRIRLWNDIEELEVKKLDIENGFKPKVELPQGSLAAIDAEISQLNKDIQLAIDTESRQKIYDDIKKLEEAKVEIIVSYENEPIAVVEPLTQMQVWNNTMNKIREDNWATIESFNGIAMSMSAIGDAAQGTTAEMFKWIATTLGAIGQAIPAITALTAAKEVEAQTSAKAAAAGAASSVAGIPIVGGILAVAAIASVVAAMSSIPKFAEGGLVYGNTIAQVGEYAGASNNPEVIAPLSKLRKILSDTNEGNGIGGSVEFKIAGKDLVGTINNYSSKQRKK